MWNSMNLSGFSLRITICTYCPSANKFLNTTTTDKQGEFKLLSKTLRGDSTHQEKTILNWKLRVSNVFRRRWTPLKFRVQNCK